LQFGRYETLISQSAGSSDHPAKGVSGGDESSPSLPHQKSSHSFILCYSSTVMFGLLVLVLLAAAANAACEEPVAP
jgi:hypothetical protein